MKINYKIKKLEYKVSDYVFVVKDFPSSQRDVNKVYKIHTKGNEGQAYKLYPENEVDSFLAGNIPQHFVRPATEEEVKNYLFNRSHKP